MQAFVPERAIQSQTTVVRMLLSSLLLLFVVLLLVRAATELLSSLSIFPWEYMRESKNID
jgi:hypothetical protein